MRLTCGLDKHLKVHPVKHFPPNCLARSLSGGLATPSSFESLGPYFLSTSSPFYYSVRLRSLSSLVSKLLLALFHHAPTHTQNQNKMPKPQAHIYLSGHLIHRNARVCILPQRHHWAPSSQPQTYRLDRHGAPVYQHDLDSAETSKPNGFKASNDFNAAAAHYMKTRICSWHTRQATQHDFHVSWRG